jgi:hypothetical protein
MNCDDCGGILTIERINVRNGTFCMKCYRRRRRGPNYWPKQFARIYHIDPDEAIDLVQANKQCGACGNTNNLTIDHDHKTNKLRGVLCRQCNSALGLLEDNLDRIESLYVYLRLRTA